MKKLWKDNGGYALAYVLIVVLVLCAVAVSVCTAALKNYQAQEESVRQTRQLYQAEGEIEKFVALAEDVHLLTDSAEYDSQDEAKKAAKRLTLHISKVCIARSAAARTPPLMPPIPTAIPAPLRLPVRRTPPFASRQSSKWNSNTK